MNLNKTQNPRARFSFHFFCLHINTHTQCNHPRTHVMYIYHRPHSPRRHPLPLCRSTSICPCFSTFSAWLRLSGELHVNKPELLNRAATKNIAPMQQTFHYVHFFLFGCSFFGQNHFLCGQNGFEGGLWVGG